MGHTSLPMGKLGRLTLLALLAAGPAAAQHAAPRASDEVFRAGALAAAPGTRVSGYLEVPPGADPPSPFGKLVYAESARIPVTILHGARRGPVLGLVAGTHGYEYSPILALIELAATLDPQELAGTVLMVHVANVPSFLGRTVYYSPVDAHNLNRVYPGNPRGTLSERTAWVITTEIIERSDYLVDLHCGDGNEALRPYTYWMTSGTPEVNEQSRQMALAFGLDHIVIDTERTPDPAASVYTSNTAITRGKPSITTETGMLGRVDGPGTALAIRGVLNLLRHFRMLPGEPQRVTHPIWIDRSEVLRSPVTGVFHARVEPGQSVARGTLLGVVTDYFGGVLYEARAPFAGVVLYVVGTPPVRAGEPLGMVGRIRAESE